MRRLKINYVKFINKGKVDRTILEQARKEKNILYGAKNIQRQTGIFSRHTTDYDIFSKKPKVSALKTERNLDRLHKADLFYTKKAEHAGTWKVIDKGTDLKKGTEDDFGIVDYTKIPKPAPRTITIQGIKHRVLSQEIKAKERAIKDKKYAYRKKKDTEDLIRINLARGKI